MFCSFTNKNAYFLKIIVKMFYAVRIYCYIYIMKLQLTQYKLKNKAMKTKTTMMVLMLMVASTVFGQKIKTGSSLEFGYSNPHYKIANRSNNYDYREFTSPNGTMYCDIMLKANFFKYITIQNNLETYFTCNGFITFKPFMSIYTINVYGTYKWVELGYKHQCTHPVVSDKANYRSGDETQYSSQWDKLYIKVTLF